MTTRFVSLDKRSPRRRPHAARVLPRKQLARTSQGRRSRRAGCSTNATCSSRFGLNRVCGVGVRRSGGARSAAINLLRPACGSARPTLNDYFPNSQGGDRPRPPLARP
jgi:hypothetical protein